MLSRNLSSSYKEPASGLVLAVDAQVVLAKLGIGTGFRFQRSSDFYHEHTIRYINFVNSCSGRAVSGAFRGTACMSQVLGNDFC